jgi:hypothetical protein
MDLTNASAIVTGGAGGFGSGLSARGSGTYSGRTAGRPGRLDGVAIGRHAGRVGSPGILWIPYQDRLKAAIVRTFS